ncbi:MAG: MFS transporter [Candidatus Paceibacterota bacterium]
MHAIIKNKLLIVSYLLTLLYALHYGIPLYASSSYLHQYFGSSTVSFLYMLGSIVALLGSMHVAKYIRRFHTYGFTMGLVIAEIVITIAFGVTKSVYLLAPFFITHFLLQTLLYICLNVFIESFSKHAETGSIRGLFLVLLNIGILISPMVAGAILSIASFSALYIVASCMLIPFLFLVRIYLYHIEEPAYESVDMLQAFRVAWRNKNIRAALIAEFMVQCFYAVMIIYSPIYLATIGISLTVYLTLILPFALIPLVVLPYELGYLADTKYGEKELMIGGLLILAVTTFLCVIITSSNPAVWIVVLIGSRIGAACVETMAFAYYFKKVGPEDASLTAVFSNTLSFATIIVGALGILIGPFLVERPQLMFLILGCAVLWSISYVLPMKDTR